MQLQCPHEQRALTSSTRLASYVCHLPTAHQAGTFSMWFLKGYLGSKLQEPSPLIFTPQPPEPINVIPCK